MGDSSRKRGMDHQRKDVTTEAGSATIVGGRPPGSGRGRADIPRGIEVLVKKASVDRAFRQVLLEKRAEAAREIDLALSSAEVATLNAIPRSQIDQIIEKTTVPDEHRRIFLGKIAAAMLAVLGIGLSGDDSALGLTPVRGVRPDDDRPPPVPRGIRPDLPQRRERPIPARVDQRSDRLHINLVDKGTNRAEVTVRYECPFEKAQIRVAFQKDSTTSGASLLYQPTLARISRGSGEITFAVTGDNGTTEWLMVELRSAAPQCKLSPSGFAALPRGTYKPGESLINNCVIVRLARHHKVWARK